MATKPHLSISFHNFWPTFDPERSFFARALRDRFELSIEPLGADVQVFGVFDRVFPPALVNSDALKVWFSGEVGDPRHIVYDLHFSSAANHLLADRSFRFPLWITYVDWWGGAGPLAVERLTGERKFAPRSKFCNFIYSNPTSFRAEVFDRLNRLRPVDGLGSVLNNVGAPVGDKLAALADYRFTLAFENQRSPGYVTEKLLQPLAAGSIPIYWGDSAAKLDFNPRTFIDATAFADLDALFAHVLALADDEAAMRHMVEAPIFADGIPYHHRPEFFVDRIEEALATPGRRAIGRELNARLKPPTRSRNGLSLRSLANRLFPRR